MFIDSHCHLDFEVFDHLRDDLMLDCHDKAVSGFLVPATTYASWSKIRKLADQYTQWRVAYGLHPYFLQNAELSEIELLGLQCEAQGAVAVGEIGLDNWPGCIDMQRQINFFTCQLKVAKSLGLPVILHARRSYDLIFKYLRENEFKYGGIVHAFNGSFEQAKRFLDLGFVLGIGGTITYPRAKKAHRVLSSLSECDFVFETDSPDMPLSGYQGQMNTPLSVLSVAQHAALIRQESVEFLAEKTYENILRVFPKWCEDEL